MILALSLMLACSNGDDTTDPDTETDTTETDTEVETDDTDDTDPPVDTDPPLPDASTLTFDGPCDLPVRYGNFTVESTPDYAYANGSATEGVVPVAVLTSVAVEDDCRIWRQENPFCDPGCGPTEACSLDGVCVPYPAGLSVGDARVTGITEAITMSPVVPGYTYFNTSLDNPPWVAGGVVRLMTTGGDRDPVTLYGIAPDEMEPLDALWRVQQGQPMTIRWTPPTSSTAAHVYARMRIDLHGTTPAHIACTFADDGEGTVPAALIDQLITMGLTGFPAADITRRTVDAVDLSGSGCLDFTVSSARVPPIEVVGYTPCRRQEDCPEPQICNTLLERCEDP